LGARGEPCSHDRPDACTAVSAWYASGGSSCRHRRRHLAIQRGRLHVNRDRFVRRRIGPRPDIVLAGRRKTNSIAAMVSLDSLKIRIFADGADLNGIRELAARPYIQGITTNPTLMRKAGVRDYEA